MRLSSILVLAALGLPTIASAAETVTYQYDAKGRLTQVHHAGGPSDGTVATYVFDAADNRTSVTINGATPQVIVVPLDGLTVIPIGPTS